MTKELKDEFVLFDQDNRRIIERGLEYGEAMVKSINMESRGVNVLAMGVKHAEQLVSLREGLASGRIK